MTTIWHLYLIECRDGTYYTGISTDVARRFEQHKSGKGARYTRAHPPLSLVASRPIGSRAQAQRAEAALKRLPRAAKPAALQSATPFFQPTERNTMNKTELVEKIAADADLSKAAAERVLSAVTDAIVKAVAKGDQVTLIGFGSFKANKRAARTGKNPKTGAALKIPATTVPKFTAGAAFKTAVAGKKAAKKK